MDKFLSTAASLPDFSPSIGPTYLPPTTSNRPKAPESQIGQASKETTPHPDALNAKKAPQASNSAYLDNLLLQETLNISLKYGDEYMDEVPITGQPGDFHLSTAGRKDKEKLMVPAAPKGPLTATSKTSGPPTPNKLVTDIPPARKGSKSDKSPKTPASGAPKPKRRKSKAAGAGNISPTT